MLVDYPLPAADSMLTMFCLSGPPQEYCHRDVKPENFLIGLGERCNAARSFRQSPQWTRCGIGPSMFCVSVLRGRALPHVLHVLRPVSSHPSHPMMGVTFSVCQKLNRPKNRGPVCRAGSKPFKESYLGVASIWTPQSREVAHLAGLGDLGVEMLPRTKVGGWCEF